MRCRIALLLTLVATVAFAQQPALTRIPPALTPAERQERRDLEWRLYDHVEFPLRVRQLEREIKLTAARLKSLEKLLAEYESFQKFSTGSPLTLTVEDTKLQILEAKLLLDDLREEKSLLTRYRDDQRRLYELRRAE